MAIFSAMAKADRLKGQLPKPVTGGFECIPHPDFVRKSRHVCRLPTHEWPPVGLPSDYYPLVASGCDAFVNSGQTVAPTRLIFGTDHIEWAGASALPVLAPLIE